MKPIASASLRLLSVACVGLALAAPASAQIRPDEWSHGTTLNGFAGMAIDSDRSGPVFGGAVGWEVTPRLAIEGSGAWMDLGGRTDAFAGSLKLRVRVSGRRAVDPFVQGGVGLFRASFDPGATSVPGFYRRRLHAGAGLGRTFTDPPSSREAA